MTTDKPRNSSQQDRWFFTASGVWFTVMSLVAFMPPTMARILDPEGFPYAHPAIAVHGVVFSAWVLLYLLQTVLIGQRRPALHRKLGLVGAVLLVLVFYSGMALIITKWQIGAASQPQTAFNMMSFVTGFGLAATGIALRKKAFIHKRLMLAGTLMLTTASTSRALEILNVDLGFYGNKLVIGLPLLALLVYDLWRYRRSMVALIALAVFVASSVMYVHRPLLVHPAGEALMEAIAPAFLPWG